MKRIFLALLLMSQAYLGYSQCFSLVWSGYGLDQMNIYVVGATINGANLQAGDRVGVFDGTYCVGIGTVDGGGMLSIAASKDDPVTVGVIDGYRTGNTISFKICDVSSGTEITDISVSLSGGSLVFEPSGSVFVTLTATVDCTPPATPIIGTITQPTCSEATGSVELTGLPASGSWTINPGSISGSGSSSVISALNPGAYSWTVTDAEGCTSSSTTIVSINPQPQPPVQPGSISGNSTVCQGTSQTYTVTAVSGATSYNWTLPSGWTGTSASNSITVTVGSEGGNISVTASNACGTSTARSLEVTVTTVPPQPLGISGGVAVCQGASETYSIDAVAGAVSYTWSLPSGWTGTSSTTSITAIPSATSGNISVTANNTCGSGTPRTLAITVNTVPAQPSSIFGNTSVCQGTALTYFIDETSGATSYSWTLPAGWTGSSSSSSIDVTIGSTSGNVAVAGVNACGTGSARSLAVTVSTMPAQPGSISGNSTVCQGSSQTYSVTAVNGATSYTWTLPSGWTGTSTTNSITVTSGNLGGNISITASNLCGTGTARTLAVTTTSVPEQPGIITGSTTPCQSSVQTYSIDPANGATSYQWTLPSGWTGTSASNSITVTIGSSSGDISVAASNSCGTSSARTLAVTVSLLPDQPGSISGNESVCAETSQTYTITPVGGATSYTWTLPAGWEGTSNSNSITATAGSGGTISVAANNSCGSGTTRTLSVTVTSIPAQPGTISGRITVCLGSSQTYSVASVTGATSYSWTLPEGWTGSSTSNSITVTAGSDGGIVSVTANNTCGISSARSLSVSVGTIPTAPSTGTLTQPTCELPTGSVALSGLPSSGSWTILANPGTISRTGSGSSYIFTGLNPGTYNFTVENEAGCQSPASQNVMLNSVPSAPTAPVIDAIIQPSCGISMGTIELSGLPASGTWTLTRNPGAITSTGSGTTTVLEDLNPGTYNFIVENASGCSSPSSSNAVINAVAATPSAPVAGTITQPSCSVSGGSVILNGLPSGNWTLTKHPSGTTISGSGTSYTVESLASGTYTFSVTSGNSCSSENSADIVINSVPSAPAAPSVGTVTQPTCETTGSVILNNLPASGNWTLTRNPGTISTSGSGTTETVTDLAPGIYTFIVANASGCSSPASEEVNIHQRPAIPALPVIDTVIQPTCVSATGSIVIKNLPEPGTWTLTMTPGSVNITGDRADTTISGLLPGDYSFILTGPSGCEADHALDTIINDQPGIPPVPVITQLNETLHSDAANGNQWYNQNGIISNATAQDYTVTVTGDYYSIVTLEGCSSAPSNTIHVIITGIVESELGVSLSMYPNPVKHELVIEFKNYKQRVNYELVNANGKIVLNGSIIERKSIETSALPSGVYLLKLESGGEYIFRKIIKD